MSNCANGLKLCTKFMENDFQTWNFDWKYCLRQKLERLDSFWCCFGKRRTVDKRNWCACLYMCHLADRTAIIHACDAPENWLVIGSLYKVKVQCVPNTVSALSLSGSHCHRDYSVRLYSLIVQHILFVYHHYWLINVF